MLLVVLMVPSVHCQCERALERDQEPALCTFGQSAPALPWEVRSPTAKAYWSPGSVRMAHQRSRRLALVLASTPARATQACRWWWRRHCANSCPWYPLTGRTPH